MLFLENLYKSSNGSMRDRSEIIKFSIFTKSDPPTKAFLL